MRRHPPDMHRYMQIRPNTSPRDAPRYVQAHPAIHKYAQIRQNMCRCPDTPKYAQIHPDTSRYAQICADMLRYVRMPRYVQIRPDKCTYAQICADMAQIRPDTCLDACRYAQIRPDVRRYAQIRPDTRRYALIRADSSQTAPKFSEKPSGPNLCERFRNVPEIALKWIPNVLEMVPKWMQSRCKIYERTEKVSEHD